MGERNRPGINRFHRATPVSPWTDLARRGTVRGNRAIASMDGEGGGIYAFDSSLTLVNTNVKGNKATTAYDNIFNGP